MANVNMFVPPDLQEEQASIERSRRYAELLRSQAQPQEGKMVSGHYVAPGALSYVNQILGGVLAGKQSREADTRAAALGKQLAGRQSEWANAMPKATPDREVPLAEGAVMTRTEPGTNPSSNDFLQWAMKGMEVNPQMAQAGFNMADRIEGREAQAGAQKAAQEQRIEELRIRSEDARLSQQERLAAAAQARQEQQAFRTQMMQDQQSNAREMARINASNRVAPAPSLVQVAGENGEPVYMDARMAAGRPAYNKPAGGGMPTEDERKAAGWLAQAEKAHSDMTKAVADSPRASKPGLLESLPLIPDTLANASRAEPRQRFTQAASAFSEAALRAATGAGVTESEARQKIAELTPQWGDKPGLIKQKEASLQTYLASLKARAGRAALPSGAKNIVVDF